ncbi:preprotein translocase subunit SecE [Sphingomonas lutea]|uniref:Protein translocase subunit SecE n=1 Tax=Sphingomonas lutea TaxID=1045317 RepID=A0A7G9SKY0_9SPHN|nr:preprotein translocase subunit SecE [Sphingomonas lutea]
MAALSRLQLRRPHWSAEPFTFWKSKSRGQDFPGEFIRQVRAETAKVHWPTRKETIATAIMVLIMTTLLAIFFFGVDAFFATIVRFLLGLLG